MRNLGKYLGVRCYCLMEMLKRDMKKYLGVFIIFCSTTSLASPKTLMIGSGNCSDEAFLKNIELLTTIAQGKSDLDLIQLTPLFEERKLLSPKQTQEEQRILETVHSKILLGDYATAFKDIEEILDALEKAAPSFESWQLIAKALAMKGFALNKQKKARPSEEAFMAILKLDASYQLDHFIFPPTVVLSFERLRETLSKRKKATLNLTSTPGGAMVFVNGAPLGQTPLERELLPGPYRIILEKEGKISGPLIVDLSLESPTQLEVPFRWEAAWRKPLCIQSEDDRSMLVPKQMAKNFGADYLVKVDMLPADSKEMGVRAALFDVRRDEKTREGGVFLGRSQQEERLDKLMNFIISGKFERGETIVLPVDDRGYLIPPIALQLREDKPLARTVQGGAVRAVSWVFIGTGSALGAGGVVMYAYSLKPASDAKEILQKNGGDEALAQSSREGAFYRAAVDRKKDRQNKAVLLGATGAVSLATGLVLFFALPPKVVEPHPLGVFPHFGKDGGGIALTGHF